MEFFLTKSKKISNIELGTRMKIDLFNSLINIINQANGISYLVIKSGIFICKNKFSLTEPKKYDIINYIRKDKI